MHSRGTSNMSIDDILQSIRNVINGRSKNETIIEDPQDDELKLTNIKLEDTSGTQKIDSENETVEESILSPESSSRTKAILEDFVETACSLGHKVTYVEHNSANNKTIENFLTDMLKPQMKEWLDANLPIVVKQVIAEEIKRLVANMNKNS